MTEPKTFPKDHEYGEARSMRQAAQEGDWWELRWGKRESSCPGCRGLDEALAAAAGPLCGWPAGTVVRTYRVLPQSTVGCMYLEEGGEAVVPRLV